MNNLALTAALATAPSSAFNELRERPRFWFPLLLVVLATLGVTYWYFSAVDIDWYKEAVLLNTPDFQNLNEEQRATAMSMMTETTMRWASMVSLLFFMPVIYLLQALYLLLVARITKLPQGFKHWFSLICWSELAALLGVAVAAILLFMSDTSQISPGTIAPLSLNELVFHVPPGPGYTLLESLTIPSFLSWALMIIGVHTWSQRSWAFSAAVIVLPVVVIYGCWAALSFS